MDLCAVEVKNKPGFVKSFVQILCVLCQVFLSLQIVPAAGLREEFSSDWYREKLEYCMNKADTVVDALWTYYDSNGQLPTKLEELVPDFSPLDAIHIGPKDYDYYNVFNSSRTDAYELFRYGRPLDAALETGDFDELEDAWLRFSFGGPGLNTFSYDFVRKDWQSSAAY